MKKCNIGALVAWGIIIATVGAIFGIYLSKPRPKYIAACQVAWKENKDAKPEMLALAHATVYQTGALTIIHTDSGLDLQLTNIPCVFTREEP